MLCAGTDTFWDYWSDCETGNNVPQAVLEEGNFLNNLFCVTERKSTILSFCLMSLLLLSNKSDLSAC